MVASPAPIRLRTHRLRLRTPRLVLRPMTERDWPVLLEWNSDPRVLRYWNDGDITPWRLVDLQRTYRTISRQARMFIIERGGRAIGEAWLQRMNLSEIARARPGQRLWRLDLSLGDPSEWGHGLGPEVIRALVRVGFERERADAIFACHVRRSNRRSWRAFAGCGFVPWARAVGPSRGAWHLVLETRSLARSHVGPPTRRPLPTQGGRGRSFRPRRPGPDGPA